MGSSFWFLLCILTLHTEKLFAKVNVSVTRKEILFFCVNNWYILCAYCVLFYVLYMNVLYVVGIIIALILQKERRKEKKEAEEKEV